MPLRRVPDRLVHGRLVHELAPGEIQPPRYFGTDLVVWRAASGEAVVMDAHCAHMGCHLAHGARGRPHENGLVHGDSVQCPFHGWRGGIPHPRRLTAVPADQSRLSAVGGLRR